MCTHRFWILVFVVVTWLAGGSGDAMAQTSLPGDNSLLFVENVGQFEPPVRFLVRAGDETLWLLDDALWVSRSAALGMRSATRITFDGANPSPTVTPFGAQDVHLHYYIGADPTSWRTNVPVWRGVRYANLYPGVHLEVYAQSGRWTWRLTGSGNMASAAARLNVESADVHATSWLPPLLTPANTAATSAQPEDVPASLVWSTFLGGSSVDAATDIALDSSGAAFVTGATTSPDLPTTPGLGATLSGNSDAFVARLKADGSGVHYLTYLGGAYNPPPEFATWWMDQSNAITVDANGAAYITGQTFSNDFPTTAGAFDTIP